MSPGKLMARRFSLRQEGWSGGDINSISEPICKALALWEGFGSVSEWKHLQNQAQDIRTCI